jgi:hypothetical protein
LTCENFLDKKYPELMLLALAALYKMVRYCWFSPFPWSQSYVDIPGVGYHVHEGRHICHLCAITN